MNRAAPALGLAVLLAAGHACALDLPLPRRPDEADTRTQPLERAREQATAAGKEVAQLKAQVARLERELRRARTQAREAAAAAARLKKEVARRAQEKQEARTQAGAARDEAAQLKGR
ncbi:MAG TPA: hypothetical protein VGC20_05465, partial [bacterium]